MKSNDRKKIEKIIGRLECPKEFKCYQAGYDTLCKAKKMKDEVSQYLECLEKDTQQCIFSKHIPIEDFYICSCPLRRYIAEKMITQKEEEKEE